MYKQVFCGLYYILRYSIVILYYRYDKYEWYVCVSIYALVSVCVWECGEENKRQSY